MSWMYEKRQFTSHQNGVVDCIRWFGKWTLRVNGTSQAGSTLTDVWRHALRKQLPREFFGKRILMLGLANGSTLPLFRKRFPGCHITAIEWDPDMVKFMDETTKFRPNERPEILLGDAKLRIQDAAGTYDLICIDLFDGDQPSPLLQNANFISALEHRLERSGYILVNTYRTDFPLEVWGEAFLYCKTWQTYANRLHLLQLHGAGNVGDVLPKGYERYQANQGYLRREFGDWPQYTLITSGKNLGIRMPLGPICLEIYRGDQEPQLIPDEKRRLVFWYPTSFTGKPSGWYRFPIQLDRGKTGFTQVEPTEAYWLCWSSQARRHRQAWYKQSRFILCTPSLDEYLDAYTHCRLDPGLVKSFSRAIQHKAKQHGERLKLLGVRDSVTGLLIAGLATLDLPDIAQSMHVTSFILDEGRTTPAGTALIDAWFSQGRQRGIRFFEFDGFWAPGDPKKWKKYSAFKQQFGVYFIVYPKPLVRWMRKKPNS